MLSTVKDRKLEEEKSHDPSRRRIRCRCAGRIAKKKWFCTCGAVRERIGGLVEEAQTPYRSDQTKDGKLYFQRTGEMLTLSELSRVDGLIVSLADRS